MVCFRIALPVQERRKNLNPADLIFLEPSIILKENPAVEDDHTLEAACRLQRLMEGYKEEMQLSDVIMVLLNSLSAQRRNAPCCPLTGHAMDH